MHIPPYHKKRCWQCIFIGMFIGAIIAYCIFLFMHGKMYEEIYENNLDLNADVKELKSQNEALLKDKETTDQKAKESMTVDKIEVYMMNSKQLRLDRLIIHQLEEMVKEEINHIIGQDIMVVSDADELLQSTIENKAYKIDDFIYQLEIEKLTISPIVKITLKVKIA